jgi:excisionase family DNA binding protein
VNTETAPSRCVSVDEVAEAMGVSRNLAYKELATGNLPFPSFRVGKRFVIPRDSFERVMRGEIDGTESVQRASSYLSDSN